MYTELDGGELFSSLSTKGRIDCRDNCYLQVAGDVWAVMYGRIFGLHVSAVAFVFMQASV